MDSFNETTDNEAKFVHTKTNSEPQERVEVEGQCFTKSNISLSPENVLQLTCPTKGG